MTPATIAWFLFSLVLKIIGKLMPLFFHELFILAQWGFQTTKNTATLVANDPNVRSTVKAVGVKLEDEVIVIYKRLGTREKIALIVAPIIFLIIIGCAIHLYRG